MSSDKVLAILARIDKESKPSIFSYFTGGVHWDEIAELYCSVAGYYKREKKWSEAAKMLTLSAESQLKDNNKYGAATNYQDAALLYKKCSNQDAIDTYTKAAELLLDMGKFQIIAGIYHKIAEIYEQDLNIEKAVENYQIAFDYYNAESIRNTKCPEKLAELSAQLEKYQKASEIYDNLGIDSMNNKILQYNTTEYCLKACLCHLANSDIISCKNIVTKYKDLDPRFENSYQYNFLSDIISSYENYDIDLFDKVISEYDIIYPFNPWKVMILSRIRGILVPKDTQLC